MSTSLSSLLLFAIVMSATPGPNNILVTTSSLRFGLRRTLPHVLGVVVGFAAMLFLMGVGLGALFLAVPMVRRVLALAAIAWMLWLAVAIARSAPPEAKAMPARARPFTLLEAMLFQWVNPKGWMIAITAAATFVVSGDVVRSAVLIAAVFFCVGVPSVGTWAVTGHALAPYLKGMWFRIFNIIMAILLVASVLPLIPEFLS